MHQSHRYGTLVPVGLIVERVDLEVDHIGIVARSAANSVRVSEVRKAVIANSQPLSAIIGGFAGARKSGPDQPDRAALPMSRAALPETVCVPKTQIRQYW